MGGTCVDAEMDDRACLLVVVWDLAFNHLLVSTCNSDHNVRICVSLVDS
jgi:hypothetical protein